MAMGQGKDGQAERIDQFEALQTMPLQNSNSAWTQTGGNPELSSNIGMA